LKKGLSLDLNSVSFENLIWGIILDSKSTLERKGKGWEKEKAERKDRENLGPAMK
jgi:hypothetical protein